MCCMVRLTKECRVCRRRTWCGNAHCIGARLRLGADDVSTDPDVSVPPATPATPDAAPEIPSVAANFSVASGAVVSTTYEYRDPEARRAYQREYMRKRRARKTAERVKARERAKEALEDDDG